MQGTLGRVALAGIVVLVGCGGGGGSSAGGGAGTSGGGSGSNGGGTSTAGGGTSSSGGGMTPAVPQTTIGNAPMKIAGTATASVTFSCDLGSCTFECAWDGAAFAPCTSPATKSGLADGAHTFAVRASSAGQTDATPAMASFIVDAVAPVVTITAKPPATQVNTQPSTFAFSCSESPCTTTCSLDGAAFASCASGLSHDALAVGNHTLVVKARDEVGNEGTANASWALTFGWRSAAVNGTTACAISGDRKLYCWGADASGMLGQGGPISNTAPNASAPLRVGTEANWKTVVAGRYLMCATNTADAKFCWGANFNQQYGDPSVANTITKSAPFEVTRALVEVSLGQGHACGIDSAGALYCWGDGADGALGDGNTASHRVATPTRVGGSTWKSVSAGDHTCGIQTDGSLWCFGYNDSGECGQDPVTEAIGTPMRVGTATDWAQVSAGSSFTCAVKTGGTAWCWGSNGYGALGTGSSSTALNASFMPLQVGTATTWSQVTTSLNGACGVRSDGSAWCWGSNELGEIGSILQASETASPVQVATAEKVRAIVGSRSLRCALTQGDALLCWGDDVSANGGLGRGVNGNEKTVVPLDTGWASISVTSNDYQGTAMGGCGIKSSGQLVCWGIGRHLGVGASFQSLHPIPVTADTDWTAVQVAPTATPLSGSGSTNQPTYGHACALRAAGLYCWGAGGTGQLGNGLNADSATPVVVAPPSSDPWTRFTVNGLNTCAITASGKLYCWGDNSGGQLGDGTFTKRDVPTRVGTDSDWTQVSVYGNRVTGLRGGTLWIWGQGNPALNPFDAATDWVEARTGSNFSCGRKANGTMHCKILGMAVLQVGSHTDVSRMLDFDNGTCFRHATGALECTQYDGAKWGPAMYPVVPAGSDWLDFQWRGGFACGLKTGGQRFCQGIRFAGSFGDDFEHRLPAAVNTPN